MAVARWASLRVLCALLCGGLVYLAAQLVLGSSAPRLGVSLRTEGSALVQVRWDTGAGQGTSSFRVEAGRTDLLVALPLDVRAVRFDPRKGPGRITIESICLSHLLVFRSWNAPNGYGGWVPSEDVASSSVDRSGLQVVASGADPFLSNRSIWQDVRRLLLVERWIAGCASLLVAVLVARASRPRMSITVPVGAAPHPSRASSRRLSTKLALAAGSFLVFGVAGWLAYVSFSRPEPAGYSNADGAYEISFFNRDGQRVSGRNGPLALVLDPYTVYANLPDRRTRAFTIDSHGFRGGIADKSRPKAFVLGGSAAFGWGLERDEQLMTAILNREQSKYTFVNAAVIGFVSGQELAHLVHHLDPFRPEVYVILDGWNEIAEQLGRSGDLGVNKNFSLFSSRLHEYAVLTDSTGIAAEPDPEAPAASPAENTLASIEQNYCENLERMDTWAKARGARFLVLFQPDPAGRRNPTERERGLRHALLDEYRLLVEHALAFCRERGIECCDVISRPEFQDSPETLFLDVIHLSPAGQRGARPDHPGSGRGLIFYPPAACQAGKTLRG